MKTQKFIAVALIAVLGLMSLNADAALFGLQKRWPDIFSSAITVNYNANSDLLTADGQASSLQLEEFGPSISIANGVFDLDVIVDDSGNGVSGTLDIFGEITIPGLGTLPSPLLQMELSTHIAAFGFGEDANTYDIFEFRWDVVGGSLAPFVTEQVETILDSEFANSLNGFTGSFASDFNNEAIFSPGQGFGVSDTYIPEPASMMFMLAGAALFAGRRQRA